MKILPSSKENLLQNTILVRRCQCMEEMFISYRRYFCKDIVTYFIYDLIDSIPSSFAVAPIESMFSNNLPTSQESHLKTGQCLSSSRN